MNLFPALALLLFMLEGISCKTKCYECGYMEDGGDTIGQIGDLPQCGDDVNMENLASECPTEEDCCSIFKVTRVSENTETHENMTSTAVLHGCFDKLAPEYNLDCADANGNIGDNCKQFDYAHLPENHEANITEAEICLCTGDLCNSRTPAPATTTPSGGGNGGTKCFDCGYVEVEGAMPGPIGNFTFCEDAVIDETFAVTCPNPADCCSVVHVIVIDEDTETHKNITSVLTMHGCFEKVANKYDITCDDANGDIATDCKNIDYANLPADHESNVVEAEVCLCKGDLCNNKVPYSTDNPGTTPATPVPGEGNKCYDCGYMLVDGTTRRNLTDIPYCGDFVDTNSPTTQCTGEDNCCVVNRVYTNRTEDGVSHTDLIVRHGCFNQLGLHEQYEELSCQGSTDDINKKCSVFDHDSLNHGNDESIFQQEVCTCTGDFCNKETPTTPQPGTTQQPETTNGGGPATTCYNCGYRMVDGNQEMLPDQANNTFCADFADPESLKSKCTGAEDCCAVNKVFVLREEDGVNHTDVVVRHGCFNDLGLHEQYEELRCEGHTGSLAEGCKTFDHDSLFNGHDETIFQQEVCICTENLCNNYVPPTTSSPTTNGPNEETTTGGAAATIVSTTVLVFLMIGTLV